MLMGWKELYVTFMYSEYMKKRNVLEEMSICVKTRIKSSRNRLSRDVIMGANSFAANASQISNTASDEYIIYVKKADFEKAKRVISQ